MTMTKLRVQSWLLGLSIVGSGFIVLGIIIFNMVCIDKLSEKYKELAEKHNKLVSVTRRLYKPHWKIDLPS